MEELHTICINKTRKTIASLLGVETSKCATAIDEVLLEEKKHFDNCDRVFMYNPDAIASWIYYKHSDMFSSLNDTVDLKLKMLSVYPSVTPVCFASMYSGLMPKDHGILKYVKPVLTCDTIFDDLVKANKKCAIVSTTNDSISMIFLNRDIDYFIYDTKEECNVKAKELIKEDKYSLIVLYNGDYDHNMHYHGPEGKKSLQSLKENIDTYLDIVDSIKTYWKKHNSVVAFAPDHGNHPLLFGLFGNHGNLNPSDMNIYHFYKFIKSQK